MTNRAARVRGQSNITVCYSLAIILLVIVVALPFILRFIGKESAISRFRELGGTITFEHQWKGPGEWIPDAPLPGNHLLRKILGQHYAAEPVEAQLFEGPHMKPKEFSDADAKLLRAFPKLKWLVLQDTGLTDDGIEHLQKIEGLERLDIEGTRVSKQGIENLQQARPKLKVTSDHFLQ